MTGENEKPLFSELVFDPGISLQELSDKLHLAYTSNAETYCRNKHKRIEEVIPIVSFELDKDEEGSDYLFVQYTDTKVGLEPFAIYFGIEHELGQLHLHQVGIIAYNPDTEKYDSSGYFLDFVYTNSNLGADEFEVIGTIDIDSPQIEILMQALVELPTHFADQGFIDEVNTNSLRSSVRGIDYLIEDTEGNEGRNTVLTYLTKWETYNF